jgi:bifunctional DNase/RNase
VKAENNLFMEMEKGFIKFKYLPSDSKMLALNTSKPYFLNHFSKILHYKNKKYNLNPVNNFQNLIKKQSKESFLIYNRYFIMLLENEDTFIVSLS